MDFGKIIKSDGDIQLDQWSSVVSSHQALEQAPDKKGTNPFTNEEVLFSGEGIAFYLEGGDKVGNISLENGVLLTSGVPMSMCSELAYSLNAEAFEDDRS
ncbi:hypothetical protein [Microbulbifer sp. JTAC008]|uniref:hypothetical protein n=1 Tax=unclassified Microbulbifer TaxID=2619833 RepID=UPI00403A1860